MAYTVRIDSSKLIDLLENWFGNVYENIKEGDVVTGVKLTYGNDVEIIIGDEE